MSILTLQTSAFSAHGGIPTYNRLVCRTLNELRLCIENNVLVATDHHDDIAKQFPKYPNLQLEAFSGNKLAFVRQVLTFGIKKRIDLVLAGHVNYAPLGSLLKSMQPNLRYGVMIHGIDVWSKLSIKRRHALQRADFIVSVSEYSKKQAIEINDSEKSRFYLLPNALQWEVNENVKVPADSSKRSKIKLLTVCRLDSSERYKGVDTVIEALPHIIKKVPEIQFIIIGSGSDRERLERLARTCGVAKYVCFLGSVNDVDLLAHYKDCDVFVMPSAGEGFGIVFLEAMQFGKPVVAADCGGTPEVVKNNTTGLLIEYGDIAQLTRALTRLCLDPALRTQLGSAGHQRLKENFTFPRFKQNLTNILMRELSSTAVYRASLRSLA